jgi:hypothetical protein
MALPPILRWGGIGDRALAGLTWKYRYVSFLKLESFGAVRGSLGDLRRATSGEGEMEPKQIGEGAPDSTELRTSRET